MRENNKNTKENNNMYRMIYRSERHFMDKYTCRDFNREIILDREPDFKQGSLNYWKNGFSYFIVADDDIISFEKI